MGVNQRGEFKRAYMNLRLNGTRQWKYISGGEYGTSK
jgi:hypothetical protein